MADIQGQLVEVNGVTLHKPVSDAFTALQKFVSDSQKQTLNIKPNGGYMSKYRLVEELAKLVIVDSNTPSNIRTLIDRAKTDITSLAKDVNNFNQLESYLNSLKSYNYRLDCNVFKQCNTTATHPYIKQGVSLYSIPNKTTVDPRRSGKFVCFDNISKELFDFLIHNASNYGFIWYGVDVSYWIYEGDLAKTKAADLIQASSNISSFFTTLA